jgi:DNA-binding NarL/FixJ family response regulator
MFTVLLVVSHFELGKVLCRLIEEEVPATVYWAKSAKGTWEHLQDGVAQHDQSTRSFPDVAVVDQFLRGVDGYDLVTLLKKNYPYLPCVILADPGYSDAQRAFRANAQGCVNKADWRDVVQGIQLVLAGQNYFNDHLAV